MGATLGTSQSKQETGGLGEVEVRRCPRFFKPREVCRILRAWKASPVEERKKTGDFPCGPVVKSLPASAEHMGLISDPGRSHMAWSN